MSIRFNEQVSAILQEAAAKLGALGYYARIEPGLVPDSGEGVVTLNVASSLEGLARTEEMIAFGRAHIESQTSRLVLLKYIARSQDRSEDSNFLGSVFGPVSQ
jgi:hypothetical protein